MTSYIVHFVGNTGTSFKVATYKTKKAIRKAQTKYEMTYGASLSLRILVPETLQEVQIWDVA